MHRYLAIEIYIYLLQQQQVKYVGVIFFLGIVLPRCMGSITWVEEPTFIGRALTEQIMVFPHVVIPS